MTDIAKIELSKDLIEPIVRAQLQASIISSLGRSEQLVAEVVSSILSTQVDSEGKRTTYHGMPLITWMAEKAVREAALEAMKEWFSSNRETLKKQVQEALKKNTKAMAEKFVMQMCDEAGKNYRANVEVKFDKQY